MYSVTDSVEQELHRIMIVDDSASELTIYANSLAANFAVTVADSADKAWELLNRSPLPDAIVLDIMLSDIDGIALCDRIKETRYFSDIPIIFLSALDEPNIKSQAFELGAADFVSKPPVMSELTARLNRHIAQYHKTKRLESLIFIDPLTHLPNEVKFHEVLKQEWSRCARYWHHLSLLMIRVHGLERVKEHFGVDEYYAVTASIADDLCSVGARPGDLFASIGDNTFALLLSDCSTEGALLKAKQISERFEHPHFMVNHETSAKHLYCSIAYTVAAPAGGSSVNEIMKTTEDLLLSETTPERTMIHGHTNLLGIEGISNFAS
ncbi:response regulator [Glaciecola siphonariae]|uniref:Response regulator n=1 Tax=Glaciecola siphonariae TaxID=521012 RepID=A0ABV9LQT0_9ALTE